MKEKIRRIIGLILIVVGISIIVSIVYKKIDTSKKQKELQNILEEVINEEPKEISTEEEEKLINGYKPIALMEIPSISLSQGIVEGISDDILQYYLGHFEGSAKPGEKGNFSVAGHRVSDYSEAFVNLYKVEIGDEILIKANKKEYVYEVTDNFIVSPDNVEVLDNTDEATITLVTCTVGAKERVIVKGNLIKSNDM
ncbi:MULTISPECIES: class D sortase [unclassified Clostridium]|uniref:class D sortase n=1 Tax=unclassified Clostridium TaxID=2614128 RepID=UPI0025BBF5AC|nr:class D sortase [Clostridium sp.]MCI6693771.1 class D sortase [Clostridium sp.]MDY2631079.1 class D sortase [Clostridium sp.]MDY4252414.1 class D sortase [Clostridium sp.]MDY6226783.1 class D sortase [Clostridium sp.]